jgi:HlyD family secretion protein
MHGMNVEQGFWRKRAIDGIDATEDGVDPRTGRRNLIIGGVVALLVLFGAWMMMHRGKPALDASAAAQLPRVTYIIPGKESVTNTVAATGNLAAKREMPVGVAGEGGMVSRVLVEPGDWVAAGQVLATVDRRVQAEQTAQMAAQIQMAEADARVAQTNLDRAQKLVSRGFISQADIDQKTATRDAAVAKVRLSKAQHGEMAARMGRLDIRSPTAGLVLTRSVEAGQIVGNGSPALFTVAEKGELELRARVAESDMARLGVGRPSEVTPVGSTRAFPGAIWQLSPVIDPTTRQGFARIALKYDPALRPGGFASATIESGAVDAPLLPESAVQSDTQGNFVYVIGTGDKVERRQVKTGQVSDAGIAILGGLAGNERVVFSAGAFLNAGDKVIPVCASPVAAR